MPKTTWRPSSQEVVTVVIKNLGVTKDLTARSARAPLARTNGLSALQSQEIVGGRTYCDPLVFLPEFAIERMPGPVCFREKFSSCK